MNLTVVIPTTGRESLERAYASADACADQVIVVADNTPDTPADLHVNYGCPGLVRNAAIPYVTGDWVGFLDDDDILVPDVYRPVTEALSADFDVVVHTMNDPQLGLIPRPGLVLFHGNVGISFAMRTALWTQHPFLPGPPRSINEDYGLVRLMQDQERRVAVSQAVAYIVRPEEAR